ncbi:MAG: cytochrome c3 family protein [Desulfuromonadales bacterium]|nr:cytochrome c3 family protein [Desulfuromonadales bacterium]NIR33396.1 cytochrome c3 family protein [Desulfuromonadales bacterium]NIS43385.1 cytochrome c3 family protein [Desulfuromonadales bacterium]
MKCRSIIILGLILALPTIAGARWIEDKVVFETEAAGKVEFSHYNHLEAVGKDCPECHNDIFHIVADKNPTYTMADMEEGKSCGACHNGNRTFTVEENCSICHPTRPITFETEAAGEVVFSHEVHTMMFSCSDCHPGLFIPGEGNEDHTMAQMEEGMSCGACHDGSMAFGVDSNCSSCHPTKDVTFKTDAGPVVFSHEVHTMMFGCSDCHPGLFVPGEGNEDRTMSDMEEGMSCGACHDDSMAFTVAANCDVCHQM